jgi:hypothetical protein
LRRDSNMPLIACIITIGENYLRWSIYIVEDVTQKIYIVEVFSIL